MGNNQFEFGNKILYTNDIGQESNINRENEVEKKISDIFSKHYNRMINDLSLISGFQPVMRVVISNSIRCLEEDIKSEIKEIKNDRNKGI